MTSVSVVVVTWDGRGLLIPCLEALERQSGVDFEVIVVDNGSRDGTVDVIRERFPAVRLVANRTNRGFAAANNQGIAAARGALVATLNNDAYPESGWLAALSESLDSDSSVGSAASWMLRSDDPGRFDSAGLAPDRLGYAWNLRMGDPVPTGQSRRSEVFGACAGAAIYRRSALESVGLFDEDFESYYEDVDLAWRLRLRGWRCLVVPAARVLHLHSATGGRSPARKTYLLGRNRIWTIAKNYPWPALVSALIPMVAVDCLVASRGVIREMMAGEKAGPAMSGRLAAIRSLGSALAKRSAIQVTRKTDWASIRPLLAPTRLTISPPGPNPA